LLQATVISSLALSFLSALAVVRESVLS
jgi:hypothetical protein